MTSGHNRVFVVFELAAAVIAREAPAAPTPTAARPAPRADVTDRRPRAGRRGDLRPRVDDSSAGGIDHQSQQAAAASTQPEPSRTRSGMTQA